MFGPADELKFLHDPERAAAFSAFLIAAAESAGEAEVFGALAAAVSVLFPEAGRASVTLPAADRAHLRIVALQGNRAIPIDALVPISRSTTGRSFAQGEVVITAAIPPASELADLSALRAGGIQSCINVPLRSGEAVYGVLNLGRAEAHPWTAERPLLERLAAVAAAQLRLRADRAAAAELAEALREISRLGWALSTIDDEAELVGQAGAAQQRLLPGAQAFLGLLSDDGAEIVLRTLGRDRAIVRRLPVAGTGIARCIEEHVVHVIADSHTSPLPEAPLLAAAGLGSRLLAPLLAGSEVLGTLNVGRAQPGAFSERDRAVARQLGATIATALLGLRSRQGLRAARAEAEEVARLKSRFLAVMAHELRTPLHAVVGMSQLLASGPVSAEQRPMIETIRTSGEALSRLVDDVLDLSKLDSGQLAIVAEPFPLSGLLAEAEALIRPQLRAGVCFEASLEPALPAVLVADRDRVWQVLINLLGNAAKFTPAGRVRLSIERMPGADGVRIAVSDTGVGIPAEAAERIFEPFQQADATTTRRFGGTGLGLAICRQLVEAMGGAICAESAPGAGTTVAFTVPGPLQAASLAAEPAPPAPLPPVRVLVVDDNPINRAVARAQLAHLEVDAACVASGAEARARYVEAAFDLVLMDLHMPGEDGRQVVQQLRAQPGPHAVFVALTADALSGVGESCRDAGMQALLTKPLRLEALRALLARIQPRGADRCARLGPAEDPPLAITAPHPAGPAPAG